MADIRQHLSSTCRHFTGIHRKVCDAGVKYLDVRDNEARFPGNFPCTTRGVPCEQREYRSGEEVDAEVQEFEEQFSRAMDDIARGVCHICGRDVQPTRQVGRCVYGACGHRQGQVSTDEDVVDA